MLDPLDRRLTLDEVTEEFRCGRGRIFRMVRDGILPPSIRIGKQSAWPLREIMEAKRKLAEADAAKRAARLAHARTIARRSGQPLKGRRKIVAGVPA